MKPSILPILLAGVLLCAGCGKQDAAQEKNAPLQSGYLDVSDLTDGETLTEDFAVNFEPVEEDAEVPAEELTRYTDADGAVFVFDKAGRLRRYTAKTAAAQSTDPLQAEEVLRGICDDVLSSYLPDYAAFTEITSQYYEDGSTTYNLAMEHEIAEGIADYALIRLDTAGQVQDLSISYADADGGADKNFVTDEDRTYFAERIQPYVDVLEDYSGEVTYLHYKRLYGKLYAFCEIRYTDVGTGLTAGQKLLLFEKE